jgi:predicted nuclease of predicted toxin-antitoxin system
MRWTRSKRETLLPRMPSKKQRIQLYADECFPVTSVTYLKSLGYSIIHAFDKKQIKKSDLSHLAVSKKLKRVLITLDRDFMYYNEANLTDHPGAIVISVASSTPIQVNNVCIKLLKTISEDMISNSLLKVTTDKFIKIKNGKKVFEKKY